MKAKKNPKADVSRNSSLYFAIGLNIMLLITYGLLNHKTYNTLDDLSEVLYVAEEIVEDIPVTEQIKTPPPPPSATPEVITVVEDIVEVEESVIESTETNQEEFIEERVAVDDIEVEEVEEYVEVPFAVIEKVPVFPGCTQTTNEGLKRCFQEQMNAHLVDHFKYPDVAMELGINGRVYVLFVINNEGLVSNVRSRGPDKLLEAEAERIIKLLPKMTPGMQRGQPVNVSYSIPIHFKLETTQ